MSTAQIGIDVASRITTMDTTASSALVAMNNYIPTLKELASLIAPFYSVADAKYAGTTPTFGDVSVPGFGQADDAENALENAEAEAAKLKDLSVGIGRMLAEFREKLVDPEQRMDGLLVEANAVSIPTRENLGFSEDNYIADLIESVQSAIIDSLSQSPGNSTSGETPAYRNDAARRSAANQKELTDTLGEFSSRGWSIPSDILDNVREAIVAKQAMDYRSSDREILIQQEALSLENRWKAIDAGIRYDQILLAYYGNKMVRALEIAKLIFKLGQDLATLKFAVLDGLLDMQKIKIGMVADGRKVVLAEFEQNTRKFGQKIDALIAIAGQYLDTYQAKGEVYGLAKKAEIAISEFDLSEKEEQVKALLTNIENGIKAADDNLSAFSSVADVRLAAAKSGLNMQANVTRAIREALTSVVQLLSGDKYTG